MRPTTGETQEGGLFYLATECSKYSIYSTFVGIGEDFGTELTQYITTNLRGGMYMTIRSAREFEELMNENFDYSVFPVAFDFQLELIRNNTNDEDKDKQQQSNITIAIDQVYGTREEFGDKVMSVKTMFPSHVNDVGVTKGCMVLLKLKPVELLKEKNTFLIKYSYENALTHEKVCETVNVELKQIGTDVEYFQTTGVHKVILLTHYINLCRAMLTKNKKLVNEKTGIPKNLEVAVSAEVGHLVDSEDQSGEKISSNAEVLENFKHHFVTTADLLQDSSLKEETIILDKVAAALKKE